MRETPNRRNPGTFVLISRGKRMFRVLSEPRPNPVSRVPIAPVKRHLFYHFSERLYYFATVQPFKMTTMKAIVSEAFNSRRICHTVTPPSVRNL
jgi:hypothetical protein